jgi:hypothetical protein
MNAKPLLLCLFSVSTALAGDPPAQYNATAFPPMPLYSRPGSGSFLTKKSESPLVTLGKSDFVVSGALIEGLRPLHNTEGMSTGQKFLHLPVIRLFVPGPMPRPPGGTGKYFAWRNSDNDEPWEVRASRPPLKGP